MGNASVRKNRYTSGFIPERDRMNVLTVGNVSTERTFDEPSAASFGRETPSMLSVWENVHF